jgi:hypothetical protein
MSGRARPWVPFALALAVGAVGLAFLWGFVAPRLFVPGPGFGAFGVAFDLYTYFLPKFSFGTEELLAGRLPLWNPYEFAGIPFFAAGQPAVLYLPKIAAFGLLRPSLAYPAFVVAHELLALGGMAALLRRLDVGAAGTMAGSVYFAFATFLNLYHPVTLASYAWMPLFFVAADAMARGGGWAATASLALVAAMQFTAGYPEYTLDTSLLLALTAVVMHRVGWWAEPPWRLIPRLALAVGLGVVVAGLQAFPLVDVLVASERSGVAAASNPSLLMTGFVALSAVLGFRALAVLGLAAFGRGAARPPGALPAAVGLATCLLMIVIGWRWLRVLPGFSMVRFPFVWSGPTQFFVAWLVALGAERLVSAESPRGLGLRVAGLVAVVDAGLMARAAWSANTDVTTVWTGVRIVADVVLAWLALVGAPPRTARAVFPLAVLCLLASRFVEPLSGRGLPPLALPEVPGRISALLGARPSEAAGRVLSLGDLLAGYPLRERIENVFGVEESLMPPRFRMLMAHFAVNPGGGRADWRALAAAEGFLDALDVGLVVAPAMNAALFAAHGLDRMPSEPGPLAVFRNRDPGARAWVVHGATTRDQGDAFDRLLSPDFDPRREVILERATDAAYPARAERPPTPATVRRLSPTLVEVDAAADAPGILVLADAYFPGWAASVDGRPAAILRANFVTRGVELAPGPHVVRFEYRPPSVRLGFAASLGALVLVGVLLARRRGAGRSAARASAPRARS